MRLVDKLRIRGLQISPLPYLPNKKSSNHDLQLTAHAIALVFLCVNDLLIQIRNTISTILSCNRICNAYIYIEWRGPSAIFGPSSLLGTLDQPRELPITSQSNGHHQGTTAKTTNGNLGNGSVANASSVAELEFQLRETEQLLEITLLKKKLRETETAMSNIIAQMGTVAKDQVSNLENSMYLVMRMIIVCIETLQP